MPLIHPSKSLRDRLSALGVDEENQTRDALWRLFASKYGLTERMPESIGTDELAEFVVLVLELGLNR